MIHFLSLGFKKSGDYYKLYLSCESVYEFTAIRKYIIAYFVEESILQIKL